jgi:protein-disulfide isomerase
MTYPDDASPDLTRKERREQARSRRRAAEQSALAQATRRKRLIQLGLVMGAVVLVIAIIVVATGGGGGKSNLPTTGSARQGVTSEVSSELAGIPQSGDTLGNRAAPVTLQYFGDLECPFCREFTVSSLPRLISRYVKAGKLKIEYHSLETATREPAVFNTQQVAALAAGKQNRTWNYVELFYREQGQEDSGYVTESYLQKLAEQIPGMNLSKWTSDRNDSALSGQITSDAQAAAQAGLSGTPAFLLGKSGDKLNPFTPASFTDPSSFESTIDKLLV